MQRLEAGQNKKIPLKTLLIAPFITLTTLALGLAGYLSYLNGQKAVNDVTHQLQSEITRRIESHLSAFLRVPQQIIAINAADIQDGRLEADDPDALERHFWRQVRIFTSVTSVYFGNVAGGLVNSGREGASGALYVIVTDGYKRGPFRKYATDDNGNRTELIVTVPDFDARSREWYRRAAEKGGGVWNPVYILFTGQDMAVAASRPVYDAGGELLGVVSADLFLSHLADFLKTLNIGKNGQSFIIERSGLLIASSSEEQPFTAPDDAGTQRRIKAVESRSPLIRQAAQTLLRRFGARYAVSDAQNITFDIDGARHFLHASPVRDAYGLDWLIAVVVPEADFMAEITANNRLSILIMTVALLIVTLICIFIARRIAEPMHRLNASAKALARGEWEKGGRDDSGVVEISDLTQSFNRMAGRLQATLDDLHAEIKERKQSQEALRESEERFRAAFDSAQDCVLIWDKDYNYLYANQAAIDHVGTTPDKVVGKNIRDGLGHVPAFMRLWMSRVDAVFESGKRLRVQDKQEMQGRLYHTDSILSPVRDADGKTVSVCVVYRDVTELRLAEKALHDEKAFTETALNAQRDTFFLFAPDTGKAIRWNKAFRDVSGYSDEDIARMPAPEAYYGPEDMERAAAFVRKVLETGTGRIELELIRKDGRGIPTEYDVSVIHDAAGAPQYIVSVGRDVSERRRTEAEKAALEARLRQSHKMEAVGTLAGGIAHDFNNILGIILGNAELAMDDVPEWNPARRHLGEIRKASMRARDVIRQLLSFSRRSEQEKKPVSFASIVKESLKLIRASIPTSIDIRQQIDDHAPMILADATQVHQVVINLCTNAAHAMAENGGVIDVRLDAAEIDDAMTSRYKDVTPGNFVQLTVSDTGHGIPPEIKDRIFDPYFTTKEVDKGTGMGLAVVHGIVKNHGGAVSVYSEIGKGTTFRILFPAVDRAAAEIKTAARAVPAGRERILFIDDEKDLLDMGKEMLERLGYRVTVQASPTAALTLFASRPDQFDLIITDMTMPRMTGDVLVKEMRKIRPEIPVILCTGFSEKIDAETAAAMGIDRYIEKPLNRRALGEAVRAVLDNAAPKGIS